MIHVHVYKLSIDTQSGYMRSSTNITYIIPVGTWRRNNVESTSMRRHDVAPALIYHCFKVMCLLEPLLFMPMKIQ